VVFLLASLTADKKYEQALWLQTFAKWSSTYKELVKLDGASFKVLPVGRLGACVV
jgi:hypothetical protein